MFQAPATFTGLRLICLILLSVAYTVASAYDGSLRRYPEHHGDRLLQPQDETQLLNDDKTIDRELTGGQSHTYKVYVEAGQYVRVIVEQRGIDVVAVLSAPNGTVIGEIDSPNGTHGTETVYIFAEATGNYRVETKSFIKTAPIGRYELKIAERRSVSKADDNRRAALTSFFEAEKLLRQGVRASYEASLGKYQTSLELYRTIGDKAEEAKMLIGLGLVHEALYDYPKLLECSDQALMIARRLDDKASQATILNRIAVGYRGLSDLDNALKANIAMLTLLQSLDDPVNEADANWKTGVLLNVLGEHERSREYLFKAIVLYEKIGDRRSEGSVIQQVGYSYELQENYQKSIAFYNDALTIAISLKQTSRIAALLSTIAGENAAAGNRQAALDNIARAFENSDKDKGPTAASMTNIGVAYYKIGEFEKALRCFEKPLAEWRSSGNKRSEAITLRHIAVVLRDQGKLTDALTSMERSIELLEFLRDHAGSPEMQVSFVASLFHYYEVYIDIKMRLDEADPGKGNAEAALEFTEKVKARGLVDLLRRARVDTQQGVDAALISREAQLNEGLTERLDDLAKLVRGKPNDAERSAAEKNIEKAQVDLLEVRSKIRESSPRYSALTSPQALSVSDIQKQLLDDNTILIEYVLGDERSYMWTVTRDRVKAYRLPFKAVIEKQSRRVYELWTAGQTALSGGSDKNAQNGPSNDAALRTESQKLSDMLLGPAAGDLGTKRLLVVADGVLHYLPFAALPVPSGGKVNAAYRPMLLDHEIVNLPSASVLAVLRQEFSTRARAPLTAAVLADPVYSADDSRVKPAAIRSPANTSSGSFSRLLFSRDEADAILSVTPPRSSVTMLDFDANRQVAMGDELKKYRLVHFSTHGSLDSRRPELSGLALSQITKTGQPVEGSLRLHEIYNMRLNADLVVLSGCQTGLGKDIRGEGLIGLTRGFMYAGTPRVVASLWQVDDAATAELMRRFYEGMLQRAMTPASALRSAEIEMFKKRLWRSPYYWGAFVLQGEWK